MGDTGRGREQRGGHCNFTGERFQVPELSSGGKLRAKGQALEVGVVERT